ncbi:hypothetical protein [Xanthomonas sacchari]|uniref:hypothetical protein n=1 Tax=Xanthomonas sacchari TaxID=56458 RepID=UPI00225DF2D2|nr:hypothetical protein [Xanthomonas sacchari]
MKEQPFGRDTVVLLIMAFGFGALFAWGLTAPPAAPSKLPSKPLDWPAWVQAVGSLLAIAIAIAVPAVQHQLAARERIRESRDRARSLGLELYPYIEEMLRKNNAIWDAEHPDHDVEEAGDNCCFIGARTRKALEIPLEMKEKLASLHQLGPAAEGIQTAVYNIVRATQFLTTKEVRRETEIFGWTIDHRTITFDKKRFYDLMWGALQGMTASQAHIDALFEYGPRPRIFDDGHASRIRIG